MHLRFKCFLFQSNKKQEVHPFTLSHTNLYNIFWIFFSKLPQQMLLRRKCRKQMNTQINIPITNLLSQLFFLCMYIVQIFFFFKREHVNNRNRDFKGTKQTMILLTRLNIFFASLYVKYFLYSQGIYTLHGQHTLPTKKKEKKFSICFSKYQRQ